MVTYCSVSRPCRLEFRFSGSEQRGDHDPEWWSVKSKKESVTFYMKPSIQTLQNVQASCQMTKSVDENPSTVIIQVNRPDR